MKPHRSTVMLGAGLAVLGLALAAAGKGMSGRRRGKGIGLPRYQAQDETGGGNEGQHPDRLESTPGAGTESERQKQVQGFFALTFALSIPFWLFGGRRLPLPIALPGSALVFVTPLAAAAILTYRQSGWAGGRRLFKRTADFRRIEDKRWYLPILLLNPAIMALSYAVMRLSGRPLPGQVHIDWFMAPVFLAVFFAAGVFEELGWMGYAYERMQGRWEALKAGLLLGGVWALFHLIPDIQNNQPVDWILWHRLGATGTRIIIVWIYDRAGGSLFGSILYHAMNNLCWALFPNYGSHYDPQVTALITLLAAGGMVIATRKLPHPRTA